MRPLLELPHPYTTAENIVARNLAGSELTLTITKALSELTNTARDLDQLLFVAEFRISNALREDRAEELIWALSESLGVIQRDGTIAEIEAIYQQILKDPIVHIGKETEPCPATS